MTWTCIQRNNFVQHTLYEVIRIDRAEEKWNVLLEDIFFDYNQADETNSFKVVFSKGNPQFDFQYFDIVDNKLIVIYMLHIYCIDTETGTIMWKFRV